MSAYQIRKPLIHLRKYRGFVYRYASRNYGRTSERRQKYGINNPNIRDSATRRTSDRRATIELAGLPLGETADAITSGQASDPQRRHPGPVHWAGLSHVRNQQVPAREGGHDLRLLRHSV